jgi:biopolymer transport protein ExbD
MAFKAKKLPTEINLNLVPMIDITSFILLALGILVMSVKKEASLDNILKLPPVYNAAKQDKAQLEIYVLPAVLKPDGSIDADSTGLVAFAGKAKPPDECPYCQLPFRTATKEYVPNSLLDITGKPLATMSKTKEQEAGVAAAEVPPAYQCSRCRREISPYLKLDEVPQVLAKRKKEVVDQIVAAQNQGREKQGSPPLTPEEVRNLADELPLMIKADSKTYYGRILQVIGMSRDTSCNIRKFAFVSLSSAAKEAVDAATAKAQQQTGAPE